jgi:hypothetical protein
MVIILDNLGLDTGQQMVILNIQVFIIPNYIWKDMKYSCRIEMDWVYFWCLRHVRIIIYVNEPEVID